MIFDADYRGEHLLKRGGRGGETGQCRVLGEGDCSGIYDRSWTIWTWEYIITTTIITTTIITITITKIIGLQWNVNMFVGF